MFKNYFYKNREISHIIICEENTLYFQHESSYGSLSAALFSLYDTGKETKPIIAEVTIQVKRKHLDSYKDSRCFTKCF